MTFSSISPFSINLTVFVHRTPGVHRSRENAEAIGMVTARAQAVHQAVKIRQAALP